MTHVAIARRLGRSLLLVAFVCVAYGQGVITTIAGNDAIFTADSIAATNAPLSGAFGFGLAADHAGNFYIADPENHVVLRVTRDGLLNIVGGNGIPSFSGDGNSARTASLLGPSAIAVDADGNVIIADYGNHAIRRINTAGVIESVAGNGRAGYSGDNGPALSASMTFPIAVTVDRAGNIYFASNVDSTVRRITPAGVITTVAGNGQMGFSGDGGPATSAMLNYPWALAVDAAGNLFIADGLNNRIRKVSPGGIITTVVGGGYTLNVNETSATSVAVLPLGLAVDQGGTLYFSDTLLRRVAKLTSAGTVVTVVGNDVSATAGNGSPAIRASLRDPTALVFDSTGNLIIADREAALIRKLTPDGVFSTVAGTGVSKFAGDGGPANLAVFNLPQSVTLDAIGNLVIADTLNHRIRMRTTANVVGTIVGTGKAGWDGDGGPATAAEIQFPTSTAVDAAGNLYVGQQLEGVIRKITPQGVISTIAGNAHQEFSGDGGPATNASLNSPTAVEVDAAGNVYVADADNNRVRRIDTRGVITTVAGSSSAYGLGDGGPATNALLQLSLRAAKGGGLALDVQGNLYIADTYNHRIRKVAPDGTITTVAGRGTPGYGGDNGPATEASLNAPLGLAVDRSGNLFIADQQNHRIRRVSTGGVITTVAGNGRSDFGGDGSPGPRASLRSPSDVAVDAAGNLYIADQYNNRIRVVLASRPTLDVDGPQQITLTGQSGSVPAQPQTIVVRSNVPGLLYSVSGAAGSDWLRVTPAAGGTPGLVEVSASPANLAPGTYNATLTISAPEATPTARTVPVRFDVAAGPPPSMLLDKSDISFTLPRTAAVKSELLTVSNSGGGVLEFKVETGTTTGGRWLKAALSEGRATSARGEVIVITADPAGLAPGTYSGWVTVTAADGTSRRLPVTLTVSEFETGLMLSQSGLSFVAVANGGIVPPQSFGILNTGNGAIDWSIRTSTLSGGSRWLSISRTGGRTDVGSGPTVEVRIDATGLDAGTYYGLIRVEYGADTSEASNSPQFVTVFLEVLPPGSDPGAIVQPSELLFTGVENGGYPASKELLIYSLAGAAKTYRSVISEGDDAFSLSAPPREGAVSPGQPARIIVQPRVNNLPISDRAKLALKPGVYKRNLSFQFSDGRVQSVPVTLIVAPETGITSKSGDPTRTQVAGCAPRTLVPAMTSLPQSFSVSAGWPVALSVEVSDDCGSAMDRGFVSVNFSNGDTPVLLTSLKRGRWQGSWVTRNNARTPVTVRIEAVDPEQNLRGMRELKGDFRSAQDPPVFSKDGVVSFASPSAFTPVAPGGIISIIGDRLSEIEARPDAVPLPTELGGTEVVIAGRPVPLLAVGQKQIDAIVPVDVNVNTSQQIIVRRGVTLSRPVSLDVAAAQPGVLRVNDQPQIFVGGDTAALVSARNPATKNRPLIIRAIGLGLTDPLVREGQAGPADPAAATRDRVSVEIGGMPARVTSAALVPGAVGIYEIVLAIPEELPPGDVPVGAICVGAAERTRHDPGSVEVINSGGCKQCRNVPGCGGNGPSL